MKEKYLIINIDDFGISHEANEAALELYQSGKVTSLSLMADVYAFDEAAQMIKDNNIKDVGAHLYMACEYPEESLYYFGDKCPCVRGYSHKDAKATKDNIKELIPAFSEQLSKIRAKGIEIIRVDSHMYSIWPSGGIKVFRQICRFCKKNKIKTIRNSKKIYELNKYFSVVFSGLRGGVRMLSGLVGKAFGLNSADYVYLMTQGRNATFSEEEMYSNFVNFLDNIRPGVTEVHFHPAVFSETLKQNHPWWQERVAEYNLFHNNDIVKMCEERNIKLVSYNAYFPPK